jgi:hypothetical protein
MKNLLYFFISILCYNSYAQSGENFDLLYHWSEDSLVGSAMYNNTYNEIWGVVVNEREFAIIGSTAGTHIFDVTDPVNSSEIHFIPGEDFGPAIIHRDYHDRNGYLYAVSDEGSSSLQIIDIQQLPDTAIVVYDSNALIKSSHNIFIDEKLNTLYACNVKTAGSGWGSTSLVLFDINDPVNPVHLLDYQVPGGGTVHDMWVRNDTAFLNNGPKGLFVVDFSDLEAPQLIGSLTEYPDKGYNHSGWPTADMQTYIMADEDWGYDMKVLDISNLADISVTTTFNPEVHPNSIAHNQIVKGDFVYVSSYHDGLQVYNISNPANPTKAGSFSTYELEDHGNTYHGAWGVYPLLPSGNILVSDMQYGLYVLAPTVNFSLANIENEGLTIYPNPAKEQIRIKIPKSETKLIVSVFDSKGQEVLNTALLNGLTTIEIAQLKPGIYFIKAQGENTVYQQKLIVK